jgi:cobalt-zinc-cadmium efflux system membrane fusion protein
VRSELVVLLAISTCIHSGCTDGHSAAKEKAVSAAPIESSVNTGVVTIPPDSPKLEQIKVETVRVAEVPTDQVVAPGKIEVNPNRVAHIVLPVSGKVTSVLVRLGDAVKQGQPVLTVESPDVDAASSNYLQAEAALNQAKANLVKATADMDRSKDLFDHNAVAKKDVLNAEAALAQAKASVDQSDATRRQAGHRLEMLGLTPGQFGQAVFVRAPISGKVIEMTVVPGEFRNDTNAGLVTIADLSTVWVSADVPESYIRLIQRGERIDLELNAFPGEKFVGHVTRIADSVDPTTRTLKVSAELQNAAGKLKPEMYGRIRHVDSTHPAPVVPVGAVIEGDGQTAVYKELSKGKFQLTPVKVGEKLGDLFPINGGLQAGERVVTDGAMLLKAY